MPAPVPPVQPPPDKTEKDWKIEPAYRDAYRAYRSQPSPQTRSQVIAAIRPELEYAIRVHVGETNNPVLMGRAKMLAAKALDSYDPRRGTLRTHLLSQLQGLKRAQRQIGTILVVPEQVSVDRYNLELATRELADELGREPTDKELADRTGLSLKRIAYVRTYNPAVAQGTFESTSDQNIFGGVRSAQTSGSDWTYQLVYDELSPTDRQIMEWTLGLHGRPVMSNSEIARKLGKSPGYISQRKAFIQKKLDELGDLREGVL